MEVRDSWRGQWWETEVQFISEPVSRHKLTWGVEGRYNRRQDQKTWDDTGVTGLDDHRRSHNEGLYIQDAFKAFDGLTLVGGLRYDRYETFGAAVSPRVAAVCDLRHDTSLKLLYGEAFRAPNMYELFYQDGEITQKASLHLKPETIRTYEVILEHSLRKDLRATLSGFYYDVEGLIDQYLDPADGLLVFRNLGQVETTGLEAGLEGTLYKGLRGRLSYSTAQATDKATGQALVNSPRHLAKANLITPLFNDNLCAGLSLLYCSRAQTLTGGYADDFLVANLVLTYEHLLPGLEGSVGLYNLFDTHYGYPGCRNRAGGGLRQRRVGQARRI
jgi:outer membrane receptor for ferrienterochelin and colicins